MGIEAKRASAPTNAALRAWRRRQLLGKGPVVAMGVFVSLALIALLGFELWRERGETESQAFRETRNIVALLDTHVSQSMGAAAEVLRAFADRSEVALRESSINSPQFRTEVMLLPEGLPQIGGLVLLDPSGHV